MPEQTAKTIVDGGEESRPPFGVHEFNLVSKWSGNYKEHGVKCYSKYELYFMPNGSIQGKGYDSDGAFAVEMGRFNSSNSRMAWYEHGSSVHDPVHTIVKGEYQENEVFEVPQRSSVLVGHYDCKNTDVVDVVEMKSANDHIYNALPSPRPVEEHSSGEELYDALLKDRIVLKAASENSSFGTTCLSMCRKLMDEMASNNQGVVDKTLLVSFFPLRVTHALVYNAFFRKD